MGQLDEGQVKEFDSKLANKCIQTRLLFLNYLNEATVNPIPGLVILDLQIII